MATVTSTPWRESRATHAAEFAGKYAIWILIGVMLAVGAILQPTFISPNNLFTVLRQAAALGFVSIGQTFAIIADCIDLSVGSMISLTQVVAAANMDGKLEGVPLALLLVAGIVVVTGLVNGFAVAKRKGNPFIVTLGSMAALQGIVLLYSNELPVGSVPGEFRALAELYIGPIPLPVILLALTFVLAYWVLKRTRYGRYVRAVGGNREVARLAGIPVDRVKIATYIVSAAGAAATGLFLAARMNVGDPRVGIGFDLDSIAAVVIGGTDIAGGRGSILGTLGGVLLYALLSNLMNLLNISPFIQTVIKGAIIVLAISVYQLRRSR